MAFGQVSMAGLAANLVAVPLAAAPMLLGVVAAAASAVGPLATIAILACRLADPFLAALVAIAEHAGSLPAASLSLSGPPRLLPGVAVLAGTILARRRAAALERAANDRRARLRHHSGAEPHGRGRPDRAPAVLDGPGRSPSASRPEIRVRRGSDR
jgi:Competence protein